MFNSATEFPICIVILTNEAKAEIETYPVTEETKISHLQCNIKPYKHF